jgi:dihydrofolate synthase/folylpolyglutamate synthase
MNYNTALEYIHSQNKFGIKLGLENITILLNSLGSPQNKLKFIHIAGTNGKGSTATMLSYALVSAGYKTGLFTSPYMICFNERIQINNEYIPNDRLVEITAKIKQQIDINTQHGLIPPTEFELVTAIAIQYFFEEQVDIIIWEVGMGGRLDATNVINTNELCIITSISYDHKEHLGDSLEMIAYEKACIMKENRPCILMQQSQVVTDVIKAKAKSLHCDIDIASIDDFNLICSSYDGQEILYKNKYKIDLPLAGSYQLKNLSCVMKTIEILTAFGMPVQTSNAVSGIEKTIFPGRFEIVNSSPLIILDAAHNEEGIRMLNKNLDTFFPNKKIVLFVGKLKDKDFSTSFSALLSNKQHIYTLTPHNERAMTSVELSDYIKNTYGIAATHIEINKILNYINTNQTDTIYIFAGSIYLISAVRDILLTNDL